MKIVNYNKPSKSYYFVRFLIKTCLLPIQDDQMTEVTFKMLSCRALLHMFLYYGLIIGLFSFQSLFAYFSNFQLNKTAQNPMGKIAAYSASIVSLSLLYPIVIAKGLHGFPKEILLNNNSKWPRGIWKIILGFFLRFAGSTVWGFSVYLATDTEQKNHLILIMEHTVTVFYLTLFYSFPIILVGILVENFKEVCLHRDKDETKQAKYAISCYKHLTTSLANFYFLYFGVLQVLFVTWTFNGFTKLLEDKQHQLNEYILFFGCLLGISKWVLMNDKVVIVIHYKPLRIKL